MTFGKPCSFRQLLEISLQFVLTAIKINLEEMRAFLPSLSLN